MGGTVLPDDVEKMAACNVSLHLFEVRTRRALSVSLFLLKPGLIITLFTQSCIQVLIFLQFAAVYYGKHVAEDASRR